MVGINEMTAPNRNILGDGTTPDLTTACADTSQTGIKPGLTVYKSASAAKNAMTLTSAAYGDAVKTESTIYTPMIPESNPAFAQAWEKDTAFPAIGNPGSSFQVHKLKAGDRFWIKTAGVNTVADDTLLIPAANGLWALPAGTTTIDVQNVHYCKALRTTTGGVWQFVEYMGRGAFDNS